MNNSTKPKPFVFVLMPFESSFNDIYQLGIKIASDDAGGYCERVDEQYFEERILDRIYNQINKADVIVADLSGKNPNVFYEVGYAHALEKRVVLLTQNADDIPFDLKHHFHIVYSGSIVTLKSELKKRLEWYFNNPQKILQPSSQQLDYYIEDQKIEENKIIKVKSYLMASPGWNNASINTELFIHNVSGYLYKEYSKIGIILDHKYNWHNTDFFLSPIPNDSTRKIYISEVLDEIFPGDSIKININIESDFDFNDLKITIRLFTELGYTDTNFVLSHN
jgi:hypothetical protein